MRALQVGQLETSLQEEECGFGLLFLSLPSGQDTDTDTVCVCVCGCVCVGGGVCVCVCVCVLHLLPHSPAWDTNGLDDADEALGHEDKEESHELEGAVCPHTPPREEARR